ncbi:MAG: hypothetical protein EXR91_05700 [Gemmatimonadetes bacterium]|nr:hypothetical protein [Gemmatimonadota bacterium]
MPGTGAEVGLASRALGEQPVAIVLELEHPPLLRERPLLRGREHERHFLGAERTPLRAIGFQPPGHRLGKFVCVRELLDGEARVDRVVGIVLRGPVRVHIGVPLFDEEP